MLALALAAGCASRRQVVPIAEVEPPSAAEVPAEPSSVPAKPILSPPPPPRSKPIVVAPKALPFSVGENLEFVIKYGVVSAGSATLEVARREKIDGRDAFYILSLAQTNGGFDAVFKVRDKNESWVDAQTLCSLRFHQDLKEGLYKRRSESVYSAGRFVYTKWKKDQKSVKEGPVPACVQDILSSLYYLRLQELRVGESYTMDTNSGAKTWPLVVRVRGRDRVRVPAGEFRCLRLEPAISGESLFQAKGKLEVWVTDDDRRMPVLVRSKVAVGAFDAELRKFSPGAPDR